MEAWQQHGRESDLIIVVVAAVAVVHHWWLLPTAKPAVSRHGARTTLV
jgi:hypothetical protein